MLKHSYTTRDLLIATVAVAFALPFWIMSKQHSNLELSSWAIVSFFCIGVAVGALTTTRPLLLGLIMAGIFASLGIILMLGYYIVTMALKI